jgi:hypothetical protein
MEAGRKRRRREKARVRAKTRGSAMERRRGCGVELMHF